MLDNAHLMPLTACPFCATVLDGAQNVKDDEKDRPVAGDVTICAGCGEWCIFNSNLTLRKPTDEEQLEIGHDERCIFVRRAWNAMQADMKEGRDVMTTSRRLVMTLALAAGAVGILGRWLPWAVVRLSTVEGDPGFEGWREWMDSGKRPIIMLDGQEIIMVETVDEAEGLVVRFVCGAEGQLQINEAGDDVLRETLRGKVEIRVA